MSDGLSAAMILLLIALGAYTGRLYERRSGTGGRLKEKELGDAIKKMQDNLDGVSDFDLIKSIASTGTVSKKKSPDS